MRLLRRNTSEFEYYAYKSKEEILQDGRHTGQYKVIYQDPVVYRGHIDPPNGYVPKELFGINVDYTHILLLDRKDAPLNEEDRIVWNEESYEILQVRRSLNFTSAAIKKLPRGTPLPYTGDDD